MSGGNGKEKEEGGKGGEEALLETEYLDFQLVQSYDIDKSVP